MRWDRAYRDESLAIGRTLGRFVGIYINGGKRGGVYYSVEEEMLSAIRAFQGSISRGLGNSTSAHLLAEQVEEYLCTRAVGTTHL